MLPSLTERDIEAGLRSFIEREFPIATPAFQPDGVSIVDSYIEKKATSFRDRGWKFAGHSAQFRQI